MRTLSLLLSAAIAGAAATASPTMPPVTRVLLSSMNRVEAERMAGRGDPSGEVQAKPEEYIPAILRIDEGEAAIPDFATILGRRGDLVLVNVPAERIGEVMSAPGILRMESGICAVPAMDMARGFCNLAEARSGGADLPKAFDGSGVVCGFTDIGFDPAHVNFADHSTGMSRVKFLANYDTTLREPVTAYSAADIAAWVTDSYENWHATHVAGILAGSYNGPDAPYEGVAPAADIAATTSSLHEAYLLAGCDRITEYARAQRKPAVINMSISSFTGPRDGSTLFNQYLGRVAEEAAVCVSAGNDGDRYSGYFRFTPSPEKPAVEARLIGSDWDCVDVTGVADLWSLDGTPFTVSPIVWDDLEHRVCLTLPALDPENGTDYLEFSSDTTPELAALGNFEAAIVLTCETNPDNGRFNTAVGITYANNNGEHYDGPYDAAKSRYHIGLRLSSPLGATIDCHVSSSAMMMTCGDDTAPAFSNQLTINDFCCGNGVIAVGAMCSRTTVPVIGSDFMRVATTYAPGAPATFTGFGVTPDGPLPHICAPGAPIVSSVSEPYIQREEAADDRYCAKVEAGGRANHWGEASGTSMSSPYAAGVLALWLQADPSLNSAELRQIAMETAIRPDTAPDDPRWGAGLIDALAGLRRILGASSLANVTAATPAAEFRLDGNTLVCTPLRASVATLSAYTPDGRLLASCHPAENSSQQTAANASTAAVTPSVCLPLPSSVPVIIAVAVTADGSRHSARLLRTPATAPLDMVR